VNKKKSFNYKNCWSLWRKFKGTVLRFENEQRSNYFYKNNLTLLRYFNFFYGYKFDLLKNKTFRTFVSLLECKLDVLFYRVGFTHNILVAKDYIRNGNALVNDIKINFLSFFVKPGSIVRPSEKLWGKVV
jgi:ribosomal protein S4